MKNGLISCLIAVAVIGIISGFGILSNHPIKDTIAKDSKFTYSTSITGFSSKEKAKVYTTSMSVCGSANYIISKKKPESYTDLSNNQQIQLFYNKESILIYQGEKNLTYVQVSSREYIYRNGYHGMYRPYYGHNTWDYFDKSYKNSGNYTTDNERYSSFSNSSKSIRNGSTTSKPSVSGGTSFGK